MSLGRAAIEVQLLDRSHAIPGERKAPFQQFADDLQGSAEEHQRRARHVVRAVLASGNVVTLRDGCRIDEMEGQAADMGASPRGNQRVDHIVDMHERQFQLARTDRDPAARHRNRAVGGDGFVSRPDDLTGPHHYRLQAPPPDSVGDETFRKHFGAGVGPALIETRFQRCRLIGDSTHRLARVIEDRERTDMDQPFDAMLETRLDDVGGAEDRPRFEVRPAAAAHRRTDVVHEAHPGDRAIDRGGITEIAVDDLHTRHRFEIG